MDHGSTILGEPAAGLARLLSPDGGRHLARAGHGRRRGRLRTFILAACPAFRAALVARASACLMGKPVATRRTAARDFSGGCARLAPHRSPHLAFHRNRRDARQMAGGTSLGLVLAGASVVYAPSSWPLALPF